MDAATFAAQRAARVVESDDYLRPRVEDALARVLAGDADWTEDLVAAASRVWFENYQAEAPGTGGARGRARFERTLTEALEKTSVGMEVDQAQVERITNWVSTYATNDGTTTGAFGKGVRFKMWLAIDDQHTRETHLTADGQLRPIGSTFDVGGSRLAYPGDPSGPLDEVMNCRCILMPASREGEAMSANTYVIGPDDLIEDDSPDLGGRFIHADGRVAEIEADEDLVPDEPEEDEELITEVPVHGVLAPEGVETGDGRMFAVESLTHRKLPLPIAYQALSGDGHGGSGTVGRIDEIFREGNEMRFRGAIVLSKPYSSAVIEGIIDGTVRGISVDVDNAVVAAPEMSADVEEGDLFEALFGDPGTTVFTEARIAGVTIVSIPAFEEAYISLGHAFEEELSDQDRQALAACGCSSQLEPGLAGYELEELTDEVEQLEPVTAAAFAPGTKDGPGWITHPVPTSRIRRYWVSGEGAAKIGWGAGGDFYRCRQQLAKYVKNPDWLSGLCANMHKEATGIWPGQHDAHSQRGALIAAGGLPEPIFNLVAAGAVTAYSADLFTRPDFARATPLTIDLETRRIYGHLAEWRTCHIGIQGLCTSAPTSPSGYAYFLKGVLATSGGDIRVGTMTHAIGHAGERMSASRATAHYDQTKAVVAYVNMGEDEFGIWYSGVIPASVSDETIEELRAIGAFSGDWRSPDGYSPLELVGAVSVPGPGFQIPRLAASGGHQTALLAAGVVAPDRAPERTVAFTLQLDEDTIAGISRNAVAEYRHQEKVAHALGPIRQKIREGRLASARARLGGE